MMKSLAIMVCSGVMKLLLFLNIPYTANSNDLFTMVKSRCAFSRSLCDSAERIAFPKQSIVNGFITDEKKESSEPCVQLYQNCRNVCGSTMELCEKTFSKCAKTRLPETYMNDSCESWNANQRLVCDCVSKSSIRALRRELMYKLNSKIFELDPGMDEKLSYNAVKDFPEFAELLIEVISRGKKRKKRKKKKRDVEWDSNEMSHFMNELIPEEYKQFLFMDQDNEEDVEDMRNNLLDMAEIYFGEKKKGEKKKERKRIWEL